VRGKLQLRYGRRAPQLQFPEHNPLQRVDLLADDGVTHAGLMSRGPPAARPGRGTLGAGSISTTLEALRP